MDTWGTKPDFRTEFHGHAPKGGVSTGRQPLFSEKMKVGVAENWHALIFPLVNPDRHAKFQTNPIRTFGDMAVESFGT